MNERIQHRLKSLFAVLLSLSVCFAQTRQMPRRQGSPRARAPFLQQAKSYEETPYVTRVVFKNGMTVLVNEYKAKPVVSVQAYVHAGFVDEPLQSPGIASLVAAMVYRGTGDTGTGTLRQNVRALGGLFRNSTDYGNTIFEIVAPSSQWKKALDMQGEALLNPSFEPGALKTEANFVLDEAHDALDEPAEFAYEKLLELGLDQPRMGKYDAIVERAPLDLPRESLLAFHRAMYVPAEILLVVSGDISASEVLNEVVRVYDKSSGPASKRASLPVKTEQDNFRYRSTRGNILIPRLVFGFHAVPEDNKDYRALEVLSAILGLGEGSVLATRLKDQKGLIFSQETKLTAYQDFGYLSIQMEVNPDNIDRCEIAALTELELLKREEPDEAEMERAFAQLELSYWKSLETVTGRAQTLARFESLGDWKRMHRYISEIRQVQPSDVKRVANRYLRLRKCSLLEYLPTSGEERHLTAESALETFEGLLQPSADQEQEQRSKKVIFPMKIPSNAGSFKFSEIQYPFQTASILRGPDMFIREDHTSPVIDLGIFFPGGKLAEKSENAGITELMLNLMFRRTEEQKAAQFQRQLEIYGGRLQPIVTDDYFGFYFSILSRNFEAGFDLVREAIKAPDFTKDAISRLKAIQSADIVGRRNSKDYAWQRINQALFRDYSYSLDKTGTEASLAGITLDSLQGWYDLYVKNRKPVVAAIGDTKGTSLASYFVRNFSGSRFQETKIPEEFVKPVDKEESMEQDWNRSTSLILIGFQAPPEDDEDGYAAEVLESYTGGLGLFSQEIRDRLGAAYKICVTYTPRLRGGSMIVSAATNPGSEDVVLKSLREEIHHVTADPTIYRDFRSARNEAVGAYEIRNQLRLAQIADLVENALAGGGISEFQGFAARLQEVNEEDLKEVARRIFNMDRAVILRMHGRS